MGSPMSANQQCKMLLLGVTALAISFSAASSRQWKPTPIQIANDYAQINHAKDNNNFVNVRWWASLTVMSGTPLALMYDKYVVISVVHFHTGQGVRYPLMISIPWRLKTTTINHSLSSQERSFCLQRLECFPQLKLPFDSQLGELATARGFSSSTRTACVLAKKADFRFLMLARPTLGTRLFLAVHSNSATMFDRFRKSAKRSTAVTSSGSAAARTFLA